MASIRSESLQYEAGKTKNIADLDKVSVELELETRSGTDKEGVPFHYKVIVIDGQDYRVPGKVMGDLRAILETSPSLTHFRVIKKGNGMSTTYTVVPIFGGSSSSSSSPVLTESQKVRYYAYKAIGMPHDISLTEALKHG